MSGIPLPATICLNARLSGVDRKHRYAEAARTFGAALERLAAAYERDPEARRDLLQEIHVALWRSLARYDGRCSLRTWVYRVAHNTAISRVVRPRAAAPTLVAMDEDLDSMAEAVDREHGRRSPSRARSTLRADPASASARSTGDAPLPRRGGRGIDR